MRYCRSLTLFLATTVRLAAAQDPADDLKTPNQKLIEETRKRQEEFLLNYGWRGIATQLPGGYGFIDRVDFTEEQRKVIVELYKEWMDKQKKAAEELNKALPRTPPDYWQNDAKRKEYLAKTTELRAKFKVDPPLERLKELLDIQQLDKLEEVNKAVTEWAKWAETALPDYEKRLAEAVGYAVAAERPDLSAQYAFSQMERYLKGASLLGRLRLPAVTVDEIRKMSGWLYVPEPPEERQAAAEVTRGQRIPAADSRLVYDAIHAGRVARAAEKIRTELNKLLTQDQVQRLARGADITEERDKAILEHYNACMDKVNKLLPPIRWGTPPPKPPEPVPPPKVAADVIAAWNKWLADELPQFDRRIDELLGPEPRSITSAEQVNYARLAMYLRGAQLLPRLSLTEEQKTTLWKIGSPASTDLYYDDLTAFKRLVGQSSVTQRYEETVKSAVTASAQRALGGGSSAWRQEVEKILSPDQSAKLNQALKILDERDKATWEHYTQALAEMQKVLPPPPPKEVPPPPKPDG